MFGLVTNKHFDAVVDQLVDWLDELSQSLHDELSAIAAAQAAQSAQLLAITTQGNQIMSTLADDTAAIAAQTTVVASLAKFVSGLQAQIAALPGLTAAQQADIDKIFSDVTANNAAIAAAMVANTPAAKSIV